MSESIRRRKEGQKKRDGPHQASPPYQNLHRDKMVKIVLILGPRHTQANVVLVQVNVVHVHIKRCGTCTSRYTMYIISSIQLSHKHNPSHLQ